MKVICETKLLSTALSNVSHAVATRSTIPALEGILIVAENGTLTLSGYDMEIGITTKIATNIIHPGKVVLNAKLLSEIVKKAPRETISISVDSNNVASITSGITHFSVTAQDPNSYPEIPVSESQNIVIINAGDLKSMIDQTSFAISLNDSKPVHMGALFECSDNTLTIVAVDGIKLALKKSKINYSGSTSFVIPGKTLTEVAKLISNLDDIIKITIAEKHVFLETEDCKITSRLLEGEFLDYKSAIPKNHCTSVVVKTNELIDALDRTSLVIFDKLKAPIKLSINENMIKFYCNSPTGNSYDELSCHVGGETFDIGFNSRALLDALKVITDEDINLLLGGPLSPMKIVPIDNDNFVFLVLPVRIKNDDPTEN